MHGRQHGRPDVTDRGHHLRLGASVTGLAAQLTRVRRLRITQHEHQVTGRGNREDSPGPVGGRITELIRADSRSGIAGPQRRDDRCARLGRETGLQHVRDVPCVANLQRRCPGDGLDDRNVAGCLANDAGCGGMPGLADEYKLVAAVSGAPRRVLRSGDYRAGGVYHGGAALRCLGAELRGYAVRWEDHDVPGCYVGERGCDHCAQARELGRRLGWDRLRRQHVNSAPAGNLLGRGLLGSSCSAQGPAAPRAACHEQGTAGRDRGPFLDNRAGCRDREGIRRSGASCHGRDAAVVLRTGREVQHGVAVARAVIAARHFRGSHRAPLGL